MRATIGVWRQVSAAAHTEGAISMTPRTSSVEHASEVLGDRAIACEHVQNCSPEVHRPDAEGVWAWRRRTESRPERKPPSRSVRSSGLAHRFSRAAPMPLPGWYAPVWARADADYDRGTLRR